MGLNGQGKSGATLSNLLVDGGNGVNTGEGGFGNAGGEAIFFSFSVDEGEEVGIRRMRIKLLGPLVPATLLKLGPRGRCRRCPFRDLTKGGDGPIETDGLTLGGFSIGGLSSKGLVKGVVAREGAEYSFRERGGKARGKGAKSSNSFWPSPD